MQRYIVLVACATLVAAALGAQAPASENQQEETTIAGCVRATANAGEFVLVDDGKQTYQIEAAADLDLNPHVNHRVELTGKVEKNETSAVLQATALKMVATSCDA